LGLVRESFQEDFAFQPSVSIGIDVHGMGGSESRVDGGDDGVSNTPSVRYKIAADLSMRCALATTRAAFACVNSF
jgi:hypothetical protein